MRVALTIALASNAAFAQEAAEEVVPDPPSSLLGRPGGPEDARFEGTVLVDGERRVELGCAGDQALRDGDALYVRCPPARVLRITMTDPVSIAAIDLQPGSLASVGGDARIVYPDGSYLPLAAVFAVRPAEPTIDTRIYPILEEARRLDERGEDEAALAIIRELAEEPRCPPIMWDADISRAVHRALLGLDLDEPGPDRGVFWGGLPLVILGGAGVVGSIFAFLVYAFAAGISSSLGGSGPDWGEVPLITGAVSLALLIPGIVMMVTGRGDPPETPRRRLVVRLAQERERRGIEPYPAFGHPLDCR